LAIAGVGVAARQEAAQEAPQTVNVELILDSSGSMEETIGIGETRMQVAKRVLTGVIDAIPEREGINVGFRIYGHGGDNSEAGKAESCQSSDLLVPIEGVDKEALKEQVNSATSTGWTPLAYSLEQAGQDFEPPGEGVVNAVVLVTDGLETCGGDPCAVAASLRSGAIQLTTHVIGFALEPDEQATLQCIADNGGGLLLGAADANELSDALFRILGELDVVVVNGFLEIESIGGLFPKATITGAPASDATPALATPTPETVTITLTDANRVELPPGQYDVRWTNPSGEETAVQVVVEADEVTWIRGSILEFPQGGGETYEVTDQAGVVIWRAPFELGDRVWVLPGIYRIALPELVGTPVLISAEVQTLPGTVTRLEVLTAP
jgi:hypothetical protein